jgi:hypothetical protein
MALATGVKASNLPLLLPCSVVLWPVRRLLLGKPLISGLIIGLALLVSYLPIATLNYHFTGSWTGDPQNISRLRVDNPVAAIVGNTLQLCSQTLQPPLLPGAREAKERLIPKGVNDLLRRDFWNFNIDVGELPREETAGLGLGVAFLLLASLRARFFGRTAADRGVAEYVRTRTPVMIAGWLAFLVFMAKMGSEATARLLSPYYPVLLPSLLAHPANGDLVRQTWWRAAVRVVMAGATLPLVLTPARPLWPAAVVFPKLQDRWPSNTQLSRAAQVYSIYRQRDDLLGPLRDCLPANVKLVGLISGENDSDVALWRPFGTDRRVVYLVGAKSWQDETQGLTWIVGKTRLVPERYRSSIEQVLIRSGGELVAKKVITSTLTQGPEEWFVLRLPGNSELRSRGRQLPSN